MKIKKIVVTGAGGYIGTTLVPYLLKKKFKVKAIDRFFFGDNFLPKHKNLILQKKDIRDLTLKDLKNWDALIDLAAISNDPSGEKFKKQTYEINYKARVRNAQLSKQAKLKKYILPSSCSNYGKIKKSEIADETFKLNPLTNYSKANSFAESKIIGLGTSSFCVTVIRQGTVFGFSPKMRFDLAINGMTHDSWKFGELPLMKDGTQRRPMLHIKDVCRGINFLLNCDSLKINNQIFNLGDNLNNYSILSLSEIIKKNIKRKLKIKWYGSKDKRTYFVSFNKINNLGFKTKYDAEYGIKEIVAKLEKNKISKSPETITLNWYEKLEYWKKKIESIELNNRLI